MKNEKTLKKKDKFIKKIKVKGKLFNLISKIILFCFFSLEIQGREIWMPSGLPVDPNGNVIFVSSFKKVTSFKSQGGVSVTPQLGAKGFARTVVINLTKVCFRVGNLPSI